MLEKHGYEVVSAYSGEAAIEAVEGDGDISLVLMDIDLGNGIDGTEASRRILEGRDLPIVFLTSHSEKAFVDSVERISGYGYVLKSSGEFVLLESIRMAYKLFDYNQALKRKEEQLSLAVDAEDHAYWDWSLDTNEAYFSPRYYTMLGYEPDELPMHYTTWESLLHPEDRERVTEIVRTSVESTRPFDAEFRLRTKGGAWKWIQARGKSFSFDSAGKPHRMVGTHEDIDERKRAEDQNRFYAKLLESVEQAIIATDVDGRITYFNRGAEELYGWRSEEVRGKSILDVTVPRPSHAQGRQIMEALSRGQSWSGDFLAQKRDGTRFMAHVKDSPVQNEAGDLIGVIGVSHDVTETVEARKAIAQSEEKYRVLYENAPIPYQSLDENGCVLEVNPAWLEALGGYTKEEVLGKTFSDFIHPDCMSDFERNLSELKATGVAEANTYKMRTKQGGYIDASFRGRVAYGSDGAFMRTHCVFEDVTARNRMEQEARKREAFLTNLMENSIDGVYLLTEEGAVLNVNRTACDMLGYTREELLALTIDDIDVNFPSHKFIEFWSTKPEGATILFESTHIHRDGHHIPVEVNGIFFLHDGVKYLYGVARDVTRRKNDEAELKTLNKNFTTLVENAGDMISRFDTEFRLVYVNKAIERHAGVGREQILGNRPGETIMPASQARVLVDALSATAETLEEQRVQQSMASADGERWIETRIVPELNAEGKLETLLAVSRDITEHKRGEQALRESEKQTREILDSVNDGIAVLDTDFRVVRTNRKLRDDVGIEDERDVLGKECHSTFYGREVPCEWCPSQQVLATGKEHSTVVPFPSDEDPRIWFHLLASPVRNEAGRITHIVESARDITSRVKTEQEKDRLMKELNHRVKNNLMLISSLIRLKDDALGSAVDLSDIDRQISAIRVIHEKLYANEQVTTIEMSDYIDEIVTAVFSFYAGEVDVRLDVDDITLDTREAVPVGLIVNEIATNAVKHGFTAGAGARFTLRFAADIGQEPGPRYTLTLSNTGHPFPPDVDIHTADSLGLKLVCALVEQLGGSIDLQREPETSFVIRFSGGAA